ncbi:DNA/RNA non-specific endonuclease [Legionella israelensis]|uniref:Type VII secretion system protein EssD-like domain-containing protein n=1 Tax=Legionella israelensis TaxID=454 RepID=A0A0W0VUI7_9GAMM|nr:DNA/RNA non-specific endonuclease [Legionella israelensis]KTD23688.1 hypothetical protein Lisr_1369 [Legionella israelensis]QBS10930.1 hypothetical protein E4T55_14420 [Legionella israelensis]SCX79741.1 DNA/RNA non-specific endonuclease [Legionella israelensis DSM 19235]STX57920.1 Uncharacterised protein [Legionella israelensis]
MLETIHTFLSHLVVSFDQILVDKSSYLNFIQVYTTSNPFEKNYLISKLHHSTTIPIIELKTLFSLSFPESRDNEAINKLSIQLTETLIPQVKRFKRRAHAILPKIDELSLSDNEWLLLTCQFQSHKRKFLSSAYLIEQISQLRNIDYDQLIIELKKELPHRRARKITKNESTNDSKLRPKKRRKINDDEPNWFVMDSETDCSPALSILLQEKGVRQRPLTPATPVKGYSKVCKTPEKGTRHYCLYESKVSLFKPLTPIKSKKNPKGMLDTSLSKKSKIYRELPILDYERPHPIHFKATKTSIEACQGKKRRISQKQLTHASCREVFIAHGDDFAIEMSGNKFHWSHLIAYFLGGEQNKKNIVPATAASNYNTLELVEEFVAEKLRNEECKSIDIVASPVWTNEESLIPDELVFNLSWKESNELGEILNKEETIYINPRSHTRITSTMRQSIELIRTFDESMEEFTFKR